MLILDEATNALDPATENLVLSQLLAARQGKTTISISHRPRVIVKSDWVVLLEAGQVEFAGHPDGLKRIEQYQDYVV